MKRVVLLFLLTFSLYATELKIASYNVENLFDMQKDGTEYAQYIPNRHNWTRVTYQKKLLNISEVICDINADIIGLQEVESKKALKDLQKTLREVGCFYPYVAISSKRKSAIHVAALSKIPIASQREIVVSRNPSYRNILELKFLIDNHPLFIYVNHWRSKHSAESTRLISAKRLKKRLLNLPKEAEYILLGDFNANYNEYQHLSVKHNDTHGIVGINHILNSVIDGKLVDESQMKKDSFLHYNTWLELPEFQRWSHNFYGKKEALDALLLPSTLFDLKGLDYVNDSFDVFKPSYLFHKKGFIYRWQYRYDRHLGEGYSDHLPIFLRVSTTPYIKEKTAPHIKEGRVAQLYQSDLKERLLLKEATVIFRSKHHAIIKQHPNQRAIFVYGANGLKLAHTYDLVVNKTKQYKGLDEITSFSILKEYPKKVNIKPYYYQGEVDFTNPALENELLEKIEGVYRANKLYVNGKAYSIFFKNRALKPKDGTYLKLKKVQIGYHNGLQLVVWE